MPTLLVTHTLHFIRQSEGHVYAPVTLVARPFWSRYRSVFDRVIVAARVRRVQKLIKDMPRADGDSVEFLDLPDYTGPWQYFRCRNELRKRIRAGIARADAYCLRVPCPIATIVWQELRKRELSYGVEVVGDPFRSLAPGSVRSIARPIARRSLSRDLRHICKGACAVSYVTKDALQKPYPPSPKAFAGHYSSIQLPSEAVVDAPRSKISNNPRLILVGTLDVLYKAPDVLIRSVAKINRPNVHLTLVGDGRRRRSMAALAEVLVIDKQVTFAGQLSSGQAVRDALDSSDIFVLPSRAEGLPRAMIEAMARGLPCIGSTVGGIPELLPPTDLVPPNNVDALAAKIIEFMDNPQRFAAASARNLETSKQYLACNLEPRRTKFYEQLVQQTAVNSALQTAGTSIVTPQRILHVTRLPITVTAFLMSLLRAHRDRGEDVFVACTNGPEVTQIEEAGFPVYRMRLQRHLHPLNLVRALRDLTRIIRRERIDWVITHTPIASGVARIASRWGGAKGTVYMAHGLPCAPRIPRLKWLAWYLIEWTLGGITDGLITVNRYDYELAQRHRFVRNQDTIFQVNEVGVDANRFDELRASVDVESVIAEFGMKSDERMVLMLARTLPEKGVMEFLEAARRLVQRGTTGRFLLAGQGPLDGDIAAFIDRHGLHNQVSHLGWRKDAHRLMAASHVYVLPTYYPEGLPVSILEAMACGKPVVATRHRGCEDAVIHETTGLLVEPQDATALAAAITKLLDDPGLAAQLGRAGRERIDHGFRTEQSTKAILHAFDQVRDHKS